MDRLIYSSLRYVKTNFELIASISISIKQELDIINCNVDKLYRMLIHKDYDLLDYLDYLNYQPPNDQETLVLKMLNSQINIIAFVNFMIHKNYDINCFKEFLVVAVSRNYLEATRIIMKHIGANF